MHLPNAAEAFVPPEKLTGYLLSETHPVGGPKAAFFRGLGFDEASTGLLEEGLLAIAQEPLVTSEESRHGAKYIADGDLPTPTGRIVRVRTVWIVEPGAPRPRFITAYPA